VEIFDSQWVVVNRHRLDTLPRPCTPRCAIGNRNGLDTVSKVSLFAPGAGRAALTGAILCAIFGREELVELI